MTGHSIATRRIVLGLGLGLPLALARRPAALDEGGCWVITTLEAPPGVMLKDVLVALVSEPSLATSV